MNLVTFYAIPTVILFKHCSGITIEDVYTRLLEKERNIENTFSAQFIRPIGDVNGELIWPRSYSKPSYLIFDNNGAAYNVAAQRPSLSEILSRTSLGSFGKQLE